MEATKPCLTSLSQAGGCGCKLDPEKLHEILDKFKGIKEKKGVVVGFDTADDCAVYEYTKDDYLLYTTDFFTPLIDDPYTYGKLAAANALSDIFAMGGTPLIANVILGFPPEKVSSESVKEIMRGGQETMEAHGCFIVGGHTIVNPQPFYGFSIVGRVEKDHLKTNSGAKEGDILLLTKPIGSGVLANALKLGLLDTATYNAFIPYLLEVNASGRKLGAIKGVHALTDVTGFGLMGHLLEMAEGANLCFDIDTHAVEMLPGVLDLHEAVFSPQSGALKNYNNYKDRVTFMGDWQECEKHLFSDPQSNGGLLISVAKDSLEMTQRALGQKAMVIGSVGAKGEKQLILRK